MFNRVGYFDEANGEVIPGELTDQSYALLKRIIQSASLDPCHGKNVLQLKEIKRELGL